MKRPFLKKKNKLCSFLAASIPLKLLWVVATTLFFLLAYALRVWNLGEMELTFDEVASVFVAQRGLLDIVRYVAGAIREHPPLYYFSMSIWFRLAGTTEFAVRYPSTLIGLLSVAWGIRLGRMLLGREAGMWTGILLALAPASLWVDRTGRMYALVMLLAMMIMSAWWRWIENPTWKRWGIFLALSIIGALTHYFLVFLWGSQGLMLLLAPQKTRRIRWPWIGSVIGAGIVLLGLVMLSPGIRTTMFSVFNIFPLRALRLTELRNLLLELTLMWVDPERLPLALTILGLAILGWYLSWRVMPAKGVLLSTWSLVPIVILHFIPIELKARYVLLTFPAMMLGVAATLTLLRPHRPFQENKSPQNEQFSGKRVSSLGDFNFWNYHSLASADGSLLFFWRLLRIGLAALIFIILSMQWQQIYHPLEGTFKQQVDFLHAAACPGDAIVLNGPWSGLLFKYYTPPPGLPQIPVPAQAPPGFNAEVDIPRLENVIAEYGRIWTFYAAIRPSDPDYAVSRWFANHAYAVHTYKSMVLYLPPAPTMREVTSDISFGEHLHLRHVAVDRESVGIGDPLRVDLAWEHVGVPSEPALTLALVDAKGQAWATEEFRTGPVHRRPDFRLSQKWTDQRGIWLLPGIPPGQYTLALRVEAQDLQYPATIAERWVPLGPIEVQSKPAGGLPTCDPDLIELLPNWSNLTADFDNGLSLVGLQPWDTRGVQGYPMGFRLWWQTHRELSEEIQLRVRLRGCETISFDPYDIAPSHYPVADWSIGDIVRQEIVMMIPDDLPAGTYHVEAQLLNSQQASSVTGARDALTFWERWRGTRVALHGSWVDLYTLRIEALDRHYAPPMIRRRHDVRFGDVLRLRGYRLSETQLGPGERSTLTIYWQAMKRPAQVYAAFNHLRTEDNQLLWGEDSWPQAGRYTTDHWFKGEVVAETYTLIVPADTPPGDYPLYIGLYDPHTGERLPATDKQGVPVLNNEVKLCDLEVVP
jgi:4-amino-4-deoxy-L-arabinose transferase-like glycosyltransferase